MGIETETNKTRLALRERAEDYSESELRDFVDLWEKIGGKEFAFETDMIERFIKSNETMLSVYGAKGMGKTFFVRLALLRLNKKYVYIPYYQTRTIPKFQQGEIVVIDDIHYLIDDINEGMQPKNALDDILTEAMEFAETGKGRVIFISEDNFHSGYMVGETYLRAYPVLKRNEIFIRTFGKTICRSLGITDYRLQKFFRETRPTTRGATSFLRVYGMDWSAICEKALASISKKDYQMIMNAYSEKPKPSPRKQKPNKKSEVWDKAYEYYLRVQFKELSPAFHDKFRQDFFAKPESERQKIIWDWAPSLLKEEYWSEVDTSKWEAIKEKRKSFIADIEKRTFTSPYFRNIVASVFGECLYTDQSYYDHLMDKIGAKKIKRRKKTPKIVPPEEYLDGYIEKEWD